MTWFVSNALPLPSVVGGDVEFLRTCSCTVAIRFQFREMSARVTSNFVYTRYSHIPVLARRWVSSHGDRVKLSWSEFAPSPSLLARNAWSMTIRPKQATVEYVPPPQNQDFGLIWLWRCASTYSTHVPSSGILVIKKGFLNQMHYTDKGVICTIHKPCPSGAVIIRCIGMLFLPWTFVWLLFTVILYLIWLHPIFHYPWGIILYMAKNRVNHSDLLHVYFIWTLKSKRFRKEW